MYSASCLEPKTIVLGDTSSDGKKHLDALSLTFFNLCTKPGATLRAGVTISSQIRLRTPVVAKFTQESDIDDSIISRLADIIQICLVPILAPINCYITCIRFSARDGGNQEKAQEEG